MVEYDNPSSAAPYQPHQESNLTGETYEFADQMDPRIQVCMCVYKIYLHTQGIYLCTDMCVNTPTHTHSVSQTQQQT